MATKAIARAAVEGRADSDSEGSFTAPIVGAFL